MFSLSIEAIILAAGSAIRLGQSKPLLLFGGQRLLRIIVDRMKESRVDEIIVVLGHESQNVRRCVELHDVKVVENPEYQSGMSTSIRAGLNALSRKTEAAIIAMVDQPFIKPSTIDLLIERYRKTKKDIVIPVYHESRGNPVLVGNAIFPELIKLHGDVGCRAVFDLHKDDIEWVEVDDPGIVMDIDTEEDLKKAREFFESEPRG